MTEQPLSQTPGHDAPMVAPERTEVQQLEQSVTSTPEEIQAARERASFIEYHTSNPGGIPANFQTASDYYDSIKNAQKLYTQGQQEIARLKTQVGDVDGNANPNYVAPPAQPQAEQPGVSGNEELRIPTPEPEPEITPGAFGAEDWARIQTEVATTGFLSDETKTLIMRKTGAPAEVIDSIEAGQKSILKDAFKEAAEMIGGEARLKAIFAYAEKNLSPEQQGLVNQNLSNPAIYETTLYGLAHQYDVAMASKATAQEPALDDTIEPAPGVPALTGYTTKREFNDDKRNPRYRTEPAFRSLVDQRTLMTDFSVIPA